jgi:hypothetical protein
MGKTCMQKTTDRLCRPVTRRRPHEVPASDEGGTADGYSRCIHCGVAVYVGQGYCSPQALQHLEHEMARNDRMGR